MKKIIAHIIPFLLLIPLFSACQDEIKVTTGEIIGNVSDRTTGEPIPTANVRMEPAGRSVVTGRDGNYQFLNVEGGAKYTISISKEGYNPASRDVQVVAGQTAEVNFTIERIPSVVTVDRETLDFGDGSDVNTMSFNIVNAGYENLEWTIEFDCAWIKQVKEASGVLKHGKTQTIVVFIDREKLNPGENKTIIVVKSSNGSSELTVTAVGQERRDVVLNTLDATDINANSATFNGEIIDEGYPKYTERGFVYSMESNPTKENAIDILPAKMTSDEAFSVTVRDLKLNTKYYVRAYAESPSGLYYSSNRVSFSTIGKNPSVSVSEVTELNLNDMTVVFNGSVDHKGEPEYTEKGFVYATKNNPTIHDGNTVISKGLGEGAFSEKISGLELAEKYHVRSYVKWGEEIIYSSKEVTFETKGVLPSVTAAEASNVDLVNLTATLSGAITDIGNPEYTEKGFVYGTNHYPTIEDTKVSASGKGTGEYHANVTGLELNKTYYVRAYAANASGTAYSDTETSFSTAGEVKLELSTEMLDFGTDKTEMTLDIKNTGNLGNAEWMIGNITETWLTVLPASGSLQMGMSSTIKVLADRSFITKAEQTSFPIHCGSNTYYVTVKVGYQSAGGGDGEGEGGGDGEGGNGGDEDYNTACITSGDSRIKAGIISCLRSGATVTFEYYLINDGLGSQKDLRIFPTEAASQLNGTIPSTITDEHYNFYKNGDYTFNDKTTKNGGYAISSVFNENIKYKGKIVVKDFMRSSKKLNVTLGLWPYGSSIDNPWVCFENVPVFGDASIEEEKNGNDFSAADVISGDERITAEIISCKRSGKSLIFEFSLLNQGMGYVSDFRVFNTKSSNGQSVITDSDYNSYDPSSFTWNGKTVSGSTNKINTYFPENAKCLGKFVINNFTSEADKINVILEVEPYSIYPDKLDDNHIYFENVPIY